MARTAATAGHGRGRFHPPGIGRLVYIPERLRPPDMTEPVDEADGFPWFVKAAIAIALLVVLFVVGIDVLELAFRALA